MPTMKLVFREKHGRRVTNLADTLMSSIQGDVAAPVRAVRCPVHGRRAERVVSTRVGIQQRWSAEGLCCEAPERSIAGNR